MSLKTKSADAVEADTAATEVSEPEPRGKTKPWIVGVGASAGGLEALREFVRALQPNGQQCYVVAQHLSPTRRSMLMELLARETRLEVKELTRSQGPRPDTVYITPPNRNVEYRNGMLSVRSSKQKIGPIPSVDLLFASLALELEDQAVGIVFSGTGSDGARGIQAIKTVGGITFAQDDTAKYDGMPRACRSTGCVDFVLRPLEIAAKLPLLLDHATRENIKTVEDVEPNAYEQIAAVIRGRTQIDFSDYRSTTILRRIARRMRILHVDGIEDYLNHLNENPGEVELLSRELLIGVTSFFRDAKHFDRLTDSIRDIVKTKSAKDEIRVWVPACATGEEAYSIAILFLEAMRRYKCMSRLQIFASDLDNDALIHARRGRYAALVAHDIKANLLKRYFVLEGDEYQLRKEVRDAILFSKHNLIEDPPFSRLDLISCRNLLIYFNSALQRRVMERMHYALNGDGLLFLGKSESIGESGQLFHAVDHTAKIFRANTSTPPMYRPVNYTMVPRPAKNARAAPRCEARSVEAQHMSAITKAFSPPCVIVNQNDHPVHINGNVSPYLGFPCGAAKFDFFGLIRDDLRTEVKALLTRSRREGVVIRSRAHTVKHEGDAWQYRVEVHPGVSAGGAEPMDLIGFVTVRAQVPEDDEPRAKEAAQNDERVEELEHELATMREHLQTMVEELETSNEELQSLNEEMQSSNEELQSTNEELETSNEELQSANEELTTVNEELAVKSAELDETSQFLGNILESMGHTVIVTDRQLRVVRYNASASALFKVSGGDIGRHIHEIRPRFRMPDLTRIIEKALESGRTRTQRIRSGSGWYQLQVHPCRDREDTLTGAVVMFDDVTSLMEINAQLRENEKEKARLFKTQTALLNGLPAHIALVDMTGKIVAVNEEWRRFAENNGCSSESVSVGSNYLAVCDAFAGEVIEAKEVGEGLRGVLSGQTDSFEVRYACHSPTERRWFKCAGRTVKTAGEITGAVLAHINETDRVLGEQSIIEARQIAEEANTAKSVFLANMGHELRTPLNAIIGFSDLLKTETFGRHIHPKYGEYAGDINSEARQLLAMIDQILNLSKIEAGKEELSESFVDVAHCQAAVFKLVEQIAEARGVALSAKIQKALPRLLADETLLRRMITNLTTNAIKFTPRGGRIHFEAVLDKEGWMVLSVQDNGVGMTQEDVERVVEPFAQVRSAMVSNKTGVGLGLALVNSMLEMHDGKLEIESEVKSGTKVTLRFPPDRVILEGAAAPPKRGAA